MAGEYTGVNGVARKVKAQDVGISGIARKVAKGFVGVNGVARQFFAAKPTWKKYNTNVAYTLGCDVTTYDDVLKEVPDKSSVRLERYPDGGWCQFASVRANASTVGKYPDVESVISIDQSTGKIKYSNPWGMGYKHVTPNGGSSAGIFLTETNFDTYYEGVAWCMLFHNVLSKSNQYESHAFRVMATYRNDEAMEKSLYIWMSYAGQAADTWTTDFYVTILFTRDPVIVTKHFYPKASYSRGDYIGEVTSESEGAYPANGRHTDGYWYVRQ